MDMRAGRWWQIWRGESRLLKTNAKGGWLVTESIKQMDMYCNRSMSTRDVGSVYCQPPSVAICHDSAMSVVIIRCQRSDYKERWNIKVWTGQASRCRHCCTSLAFRSQRSITEQIFNLRLLVEKHLEHQKELFHNFINLRKRLIVSSMMASGES